jgi:hypothetical protein
MDTNYRTTTLYTFVDPDNNPSKLSYIEVDVDNNQFDIKIRFKNKQDAQEFEESLSKNIQFYRDGDIIAMHYKSELYQKGLFLQKLMKLEPRVSDISEELFKGLKLGELTKLKQMPVNEAINFAINYQAQEFSCVEWLLFEYLDDKKIPPNSILKLINGISPANPCSQTGNDIGLRFITSTAANPLLEQKTEQASLSLDTETTTEAVRFKNLELELAYALKGSVKGLAATIYSQLCNDPWDMEPFEDVPNDYEFLVKQARRIREERAGAKLIKDLSASSGIASSSSTSSGVASSSSTSSGVASSSSTSSGVASSSSTSSGVASSSSTLSGVVSSSSTSSGVVSSSSTSSGITTSPSTADTQVTTIRFPGPRVSRLLNLFTQKPASGTKPGSGSPSLEK